MAYYYSDERNVQMLIELLHKYNIRRVIASPGSANVRFVASIQQDPFFTMYSVVDERSAAYMACGLSAECGEPVVITCTGATASRNYLPALTEAYYRHLPIVVVTVNQHSGMIGQNVPQVLDRTVSIKDTLYYSVNIPIIHDDTDAWASNVKINSALHELTRNEGGPVQIELTTSYNPSFSVKVLPDSRKIELFNLHNMPELNAKRIGVFIGAHKKWNSDSINALDSFCEKYNAVVFYDHTSNYTGKYGILPSLVSGQLCYSAPCKKMDMLIHIGDVSGAYYKFDTKAIWRVHPDGMIRDTYRQLKAVFQMNEIDFFEYYNQRKTEEDTSYYNEWKDEYYRISEKIPELPFSNIWIAQNTCKMIPENSVMHFGILNTLRSWNFFLISKTISVYSNTGGFGIDGGVSTLIGASLSNSDKLYFGLFGDLAFFYDINSIGNRHLGNNVRIMIINNGRGTEFRNFIHPFQIFGDDVDDYIAAAGHYGNQSRVLVKHFASDLGFEYMSATNKEEYKKTVARFVSNERYEKPLLFEVFVDSESENAALYQMYNLIKSVQGSAKQVVKGVLGDSNISKINKMFRK